MSYYKITYNGKSFVASYERQGNHFFRVRLEGCITIHIYSDKNCCYLIHAIHHKECSLDNETYIRDMIFATLQLCKHLHPTLKYMILQDDSFIQCQNGKQLPLPDVYMLLYGQTWYQKHFGATPEDKKAEIALVSEYLKGKPSVQWKEIWDEYLSRGFKHEDEVRLHDVYNTSQSWHVFFNRIRHGKNGCGFL